LKRNFEQHRFLELPFSPGPAWKEEGVSDVGFDVTSTKQTRIKKIHPQKNFEVEPEEIGGKTKEKIFLLN